MRVRGRLPNKFDSKSGISKFSPTPITHIIHVIRRHIVYSSKGFSLVQLHHLLRQHKLIEKYRIEYSQISLTPLSPIYHQEELAIARSLSFYMLPKGTYDSHMIAKKIYVSFQTNIITSM